MNIRAREMAVTIKAETGGRFDLQVFPNNQLGSDTDTLSQLRSGGVEFFTLSGLIPPTLVPAAAINGVGFAFPDAELRCGKRWTVRSAALCARRSPRPIWSPWKRSGTTASARSPRRRSRLSGRMISRGFKIRVPVSPLWTSMFEAFDAAPALDQFQRGVFVVADQGGGRRRRSAGADFHGEALRGAGLLLADQPHVGRLLVPGQSPRPGAAAAGHAHHRAKHINAAAVNERADVAALNAGVRQKELASRGLKFNRPDPAPFSRQAAQGRLLQRVERQVRREGAGRRSRPRWGSFRAAMADFPRYSDEAAGGRATRAAASSSWWGLLEDRLGRVVEIAAAVLVLAEVVILLAGRHRPLCACSGR